MTVGANVFPRRPPARGQVQAPSDAAPVEGFRKLPQDVANKLVGWSDQELFDFTKPLRMTARYRRAQDWSPKIATLAIGIALGVAAGHWLAPWTWGVIATWIGATFVIAQLVTMKRKLDMIEATREGEKGIVDLGPQATTPEKGIELAARRVNPEKADEFAARVAAERKDQVA